MTVNDVPTTFAPDVEPESPLLSPELESLLDVGEGAEPVAVPAAVPEAEAEAEEPVEGEVDATNGLESEEMDAWLRSKSNCL